MPKILSRLVPALIFGLFFYIGYLVLATRHVPDIPVQRFGNWQQADVGYGIPVDASKPADVQQLDPRMHFHSPFEYALIPTTPRMDPPMGSEHAALTYNAQKFMEMNALRGGQHTGDDINGIGGQNSDLGDPVYAVGNGLVIYAGTPSDGWGKTVILAHRLSDKRTLHSMYAHLDSINTALGLHVGRGAQIGTVGNANGYYLAHLHLEMRETDGFSPTRGYTRHPFDRLDPEATVAEHRNVSPTDLNPSILTILQQSQRSNYDLPSMDAESALKLQEFLQKSEKSKQ